MVSISWQSLYAPKLSAPKEALRHISNGQTVFIGSGAGEPVLLMDTLAEIATEFWGIDIIHLITAREKLELAKPELASNFRYKTFYTGRGVSEAASSSAADFTPINISELPGALANRIVVVDVALIQVSPPDNFGLCSLGVSVDATKAAAEHAKLVIAQVNENMPATLGDSQIPVEKIDFLVEGNAPLIEVPSPKPDPVSLTIGRHIADLIIDGMTLHFDSGPISAAAMRYLDSKKDLGIHTDVVTDDILRLCKSRAVTNRKKKVYKGKTVATMAVGSQELYQTLDTNPHFEFLSIDEVNDPRVISQDDNMVSVHSAQEMELTGLARTDTENILFSHNPLSSMDFLSGAHRSKNGFTIVALPSTTADGLRSRIVGHSVSRGVAFSRHKVNYVVTEYGVVNLYGRSIRERAIALISIAHPKFRQQLLEEAKKFNYVHSYQVIPPESGCIYPRQYEFTHTFDDGTTISFRPVKPSDARRIQRMFYHLSPEARRMRYHGTIKVLSNKIAQRLAAIDYSRDMAIVGLVGPRSNPRIIAEARHMYNPHNNMCEFDVVVADDFCRRGIGEFLANYLNRIAYSRGMSGVYAEVLLENEATIALLSKAWPTATRSFGLGVQIFTVHFPEEDIKRPKESIIIYSGRFGDYSYGENHPFDAGRATIALQLIKAQGYLSEPWMRVEEPRIINKEQLIESSTPSFIDALEEANSGQGKEEFLQFNLGGDDCPVFPGLFDYVLLYTSATIAATEMIMDHNANVVFNPLGGFHHSSRDHAEGFCYVNDVLVAIDMLLARGYRVAYLDFDAHHGNGVQDAYFRDDRVLTISLHESGKTLYPWSGFEQEIGEDIGTGFNINIPLPAGTDDEAYGMVLKRIVPCALEKFDPSVLVMVIGADTHKADPLSHLNLTNRGMVNAIKAVRDYSQHILLLGGGGYDLRSVSRGWCRMWAAANHIDSLPDYMLALGGTFMGSEGLHGAEIVDMIYRESGEQKELVMKELERIAVFHERNTLPLIGKRARGSQKILFQI